MKLIRVHVGPCFNPDDAPVPGDNKNAGHGGDFPDVKAAKEAAKAYGRPAWLEPIEWNEDTSEPVYTNAGDIEPVT